MDGDLERQRRRERAGAGVERAGDEAVVGDGHAHADAAGGDRDGRGQRAGAKRQELALVTAADARERHVEGRAGEHVLIVARGRSIRRRGRAAFRRLRAAARAR